MRFGGRSGRPFGIDLDVEVALLDAGDRGYRKLDEIRAGLETDVGSAAHVRAGRRDCRPAPDHPDRLADMVGLPRGIRMPAAIRALLAITIVSAFVVIGILVIVKPEAAVTAAIIAAAATVLGGSLSVAVGRYYEKVQELDEVTRQRKVDAYGAFIAVWFRILYAQKLEQEQPSGTEMMKWMVDFTEALVMWGSDDVIKQWGALRRRWGTSMPLTRNEASRRCSISSN
jgi:hypothetical protein